MKNNSRVTKKVMEQNVSSTDSFDPQQRSIL